MRLHRLAALLLLGLSGCLIHNIAPSERLRDAVVGLNDEARWSRMDLASERVVPAYRAAWTRAHRGWGRDIQIGDVELLDVRLADDNETAVSVVAISWYRHDTMMLTRTVLRQEWQSAGNGFQLASEEVSDGDPGLLAAEEPEERASAQRTPGEAPGSG